MGQKYLAEIKARGEAAAVHEYDGITDLVYGRDVKALLAEVKRLMGKLADQTARANICEHDAKTWREDRDRLLADNAAKDQQIATLEKALEMMAEETVAALHKLDKIGVIDITADGTAKGLADYFIKQAQEQEGKK